MAQVNFVERQFPNDWHLALTTTEFLIHPQFRETLAQIDSDSSGSGSGSSSSSSSGCVASKPPPMRVRFLPTLTMVGDDSKPLRRHESLASQRSMYQWNSSWTMNDVIHGYLGGRYLHAGCSGHGSRIIYMNGRHQVHKPYRDHTVHHESGFILKYQWTPWPDSISRKMQIGHNGARLCMHSVPVHACHLLTLRAHVYNAPHVRVCVWIICPLPSRFSRHSPTDGHQAQDGHPPRRLVAPANAAQVPPR